MLVVGFEFEYANTNEDQTLQRPSLRTTSGNVLAADVRPARFQFYCTTGGGHTTASELGNGRGNSVRC